MADMLDLRLLERREEMDALPALSGSALSVRNFEAWYEQVKRRAVVTCDRCGAECDADQIDVTALGDPERRFVWGYIGCVTTGCADEYGDRSVEPPDEPGQLTREDRKWLRRQRAFLLEYERVARVFAEATTGW